MSINVTVSGNPVCIKGGGMVTSFDPSKAEYEKRRLMRLEQVRQQSKDIAETVRNRVKGAKSRQLSRVEEEGAVKLRNWQARKLLDLQNQYQEVLEDLGIGHKSAEAQEKEEEAYVEQLESADCRARERGKGAAERLQVERNEEGLKRATPQQRKKLTRDGENSRARRVARSPKKKRRVETFDSDVENRVPRLSDLEEGMQSDVSSYLKINTRNNTPSPPVEAEKVTRMLQTDPTNDKAAQTVTPETILSPRKTQVPKDTRISERIRRRATLNDEPDYCDYVEKEISIPDRDRACTCCQRCDRNLEAVEDPKKTSTTVDEQSDQQSGVGLPKKAIPSAKESRKRSPGKHRNDESNQQSGVGSHKRPVKLKSPARHKKEPHLPADFSVLPARSPKRPPIRTRGPYSVTIPPKPKATLKSVKPVQICDHFTKTTRRVTPTFPCLTKIDEADLDFSPTMTDDELRTKLKQRDEEAQIRGRVAMEKEKIQREYRELLRKLPVLQKQERIGEIGLDRPEYHMSDGRLEELERKRQNRLDNAYEELFVKNRPAKVTIPRKADEEVAPPNPARWDVDFEPSNSREEQLNKLLEQLKAQKENLMREIEGTLTGNSLEECNGGKRKREGRQSSPESSGDRSKVKKKRKSPTKKKVKTLVLQNTSTQTTPKVASPEVKTTRVAGPPCDCVKDDLCEILIKIKDGDEPEVVVNPPGLGKVVTVVTEDAGTAPRTPEGSRSQSTRGRSSWGVHLSHASTTSTTSTSYMDLPDCKASRPEASRVAKPARPPSEASKGKATRDAKPARPPSEASRAKATRIPAKASGRKPISPTGEIDPRLLTYIKKLLTMTHGSVESLAVSSVSDVSTPCTSVVETPSNTAMAQLKTVMKYFQLDPREVQKQLSQSESSSSSSDKPFQSCVEINSKFHEIAESCNKKISDLAAKIEKVREEKLRIINSASLTDSEKTSSDELLGIDLSYAERLKSLSTEQLAEEKKKLELEKSTDDELLDKLKNLLSTDDPPLFLNIPKLPKLEAASKKKPPPSKGLRILNGNVPVLPPHELSTIVEADSASKIDRLPDDSSSSSTDILTVPDKNCEKSTSSDDVESMLKSIGMEWAIPTLKKTREALALASTSSDSSGKKSSSEISLREFLSKISSDSQDLSLVQVDARRTSTPVQGGDRRVAFATDSDLSSVRRESERSSRFFEVSSGKSRRDSGERYRDLENSSGGSR